MKHQLVIAMVGTIEKHLQRPVLWGVMLDLLNFSYVFYVNINVDQYYWIGGSIIGLEVYVGVRSGF
jgi:hypothetical protein